MHFHLKFNFSVLAVKFLKSKTTRSKFVAEEEKELWDKGSGERMTDEETDSNSKGDNKRKKIFEA